MGAFDRFKTRDKANEGIKVPLLDPETGEDTGEWLVVLSQWSDAFQQARQEAEREVLLRSRGMGDQETAQLKADNLVAALVADWSNDQECTLDNVREFLKEAPQIREQINQLAGDDARFFGKPSGGSKSGRKRK